MIDWAARAQASLAVKTGLSPPDETGETPVPQVLAALPDGVPVERGAGRTADLPEADDRTGTNWSMRLQDCLGAKAARNPADETAETNHSSVSAAGPGQSPTTSHTQPDAVERSGGAATAADWIDPVPSGGRDILSLLDLQPMGTEELAHALGWRRGEVMGLVIRLRKMGAVRLKGTRWILTSEADRFALPARSEARLEASRTCGEGGVPDLGSGDAPTAPP